MENPKIKSKTARWIMLIAALGRVILANKIGIWFPCNQLYDDVLLVKYANLVDHFSNPGPTSLLKYMGYPVFLKFVSLTHLPYATVTACLWILAALCVYGIAKRLTGRRIISVVAYLYVLYMPIAFDLYSGTRLYRNAVIAPFSLISLACMGLMILQIKSDKRGILKSCGIALLTGISFTWCYYLKEDGIWLKVCLLFSVGYALVSLVITIKQGKQRNMKAFTTALVLLAVPFVLYRMTDNYYRKVNYKAFGVSDLNTRTEGELGKFVSLIYKIDSVQRTAAIWAPDDAIQKAFEVSPTLGEHSELLQAIRTSGWCGGDIEKNPITGDFLTWVLRDALCQTGIWQSEKQISDLFEMVNYEIQDAFESGTLKKDKRRIQLLNSAGGRTVKDILDLFPIVYESFKCVTLVNGYVIDCGVLADDMIDSERDLCEFAGHITNTEYLSDYSDRYNTVSRSASVCKILLLFYKIINPILFVGSVLIIIGQIFAFLVNWKKRKRYLELRGARLEMAFMSFVLFGVSFVYSFGIAWFSSFLGEQELWILNFYNIALPGILALAYLLAFSSIFANRGKNRRKKETIDG